MLILSMLTINLLFFLLQSFKCIILLINLIFRYIFILFFLKIWEIKICNVNTLRILNVEESIWLFKLNSPIEFVQSQLEKLT